MEKKTKATPILISRYADYITKTDRFASRSPEERQRISIYGLVSEIGSVVSAVKKQELGQTSHRRTCHELREELGDVLWYCFALANIEGIGDDDILSQGLEAWGKLLMGKNERAALYRKRIGDTRLKKFCERAKAFPRKKQGTFQEFQEIVCLTAQDKSSDIVGASLVELMNLSAQLVFPLLPEQERRLHSQVHERLALDVLKEISWHLTVIANVYELSLEEIVDNNIQKAQLHKPDPPLISQSESQATPLHDQNFPDTQQLPRLFEVKFLTVGEGLSRMYWGDGQLGDDLTDNFYEDDGYRFHDALHLANIAHLGWSPVLRGLMKRKRKANPKIDEVQDGARAVIIEEAILKLVHSEGKERAAVVYPHLDSKVRPVFSDEVDIPASFLKLIQRYVKGLEVENNSFHEWEMAIREGCRIYNELRIHGQGTVTVNLGQREITFRPDVYVDIIGAVVGFGSYVVLLSEFEGDSEDNARTWLTEAERSGLGNIESAYLARYCAAKHAILRALGINNPGPEHFAALSLTEIDSGQFSVKTESPLREMMWKRKVIVFKTSFSQSQNSIHCTALALSDASKS